VSTHAAASDDDPDGSAAEPPAVGSVRARGSSSSPLPPAVDRPLRDRLGVALGRHPGGRRRGVAHGYLPRAARDRRNSARRALARRAGIADFGLFKWLYAVVALIAPPVAIVYYAHREWLKPGDPSLLGGPP